MELQGGDGQGTPADKGLGPIRLGGAEVARWQAADLRGRHQVEEGSGREGGTWRRAKAGNT